MKFNLLVTNENRDSLIASAFENEPGRMRLALMIGESINVAVKNNMARKILGDYRPENCRGSLFLPCLVGGEAEKYRSQTGDLCWENCLHTTINKKKVNSDNAFGLLEELADGAANDLIEQEILALIALADKASNEKDDLIYVIRNQKIDLVLTDTVGL